MLKKLLQILNRKLSYSRYNRELLQKDLYHCLLKDRSSNHFDDLYNVIHIGAYYDLHDVKQYRKNEYIPYAIKYSELVKKYHPEIIFYPNKKLVEGYIEYLYPENDEYK